MTTFRYFLGPRSDMSGLARQPETCTFCGSVGDTFELDHAFVPGLSDDERSSKHGCFVCLAAGRFGFDHDTDIGTISGDGLSPRHEPPPPGFRADALDTLRHTPDVARWQYEPWLTHCDDFMAYLGTWQPSDFVRNAPDGNGRSLFLRMTPDEPERDLWDQCAEGAAVPEDGWHASYYAYRCLHCGELAGNWDCD